MSHDLIVLAGPPGAAHSAQRLAAVQHAARAVPGFTAVEYRQTETVAAAVVRTDVAGGSVSDISRDTSGTRLTVALKRSGLTAASSSARSGSEAAHACILLEAGGSVTITTDGVAVVPVYWGVSGDVLAASTHLASLVSLGIPADPDERGVVEYLTFHHPLGDRTMLRHARVLPPGGRLQWRAGRVVEERADPAFAPSSNHLSDREAVAEFAEVWPTVIDAAFSDAGRVAVSLSGGMDSRTIAGGAVAQGWSPLTFTYGDAPTWEVRTATRIAQELGTAHLRLPVIDAQLLSGAGEWGARLDGAHSPNELYDLWFADVLREVSDTVVNGHAGDPLWGDGKAIGLSAPEPILESLWSRYLPQARQAAGFLAGDLGSGATALAREALAESLSRLDCSRPDAAVRWNMTNRQFRWGNMLVTGLRRTGIRAETPFLDRRFLALASRFSPEQYLHGRLYLQVQRAIFPRTSAVPRSDDGNAPRNLSHVYWSADTSQLRQLAALTARHPVSGLRRGLRYGTQEGAVQIRRRLGISGPADRLEARRSVFPIDLWLRTRPVYAQRLAELLAADDHPLVSGRAVDEAVSSLAAGQPIASASVLGRVAAVRSWLADYRRRGESFAALTPAADSVDPVVGSPPRG